MKQFVFMYIYVQIVAIRYLSCVFLVARGLLHVVSGRIAFIFHICNSHTDIYLPGIVYWPGCRLVMFILVFVLWNALCCIGIDIFYFVCFHSEWWSWCVTKGHDLDNKFTDESKEYFVIIKLWIIQQKYTLSKWDCGWIGTRIWFWRCGLEFCVQ